MTTTRTSPSGPLVEIPTPADPLATDVESFPLSAGAETTTNTTRVFPIYIPEDMTVRSFFTFFRALDTATQWHMALYDLGGTLLAQMSPQAIAVGLVRGAALAAVDVTAGVYLLGLARDGGGGGVFQGFRYTDFSSAIVGADLGSATFPLPASITVGTNSLKYWGGVSEITP